MHYVDSDGRFIRFYTGEFKVADYSFDFFDNTLIVKKDCKTIGKCEINTELIGWLFKLLDFIIRQRHMKELRYLCFNNITL